MSLYSDIMKTQKEDLVWRALSEPIRREIWIVWPLSAYDGAIGGAISDLCRTG